MNFNRILSSKRKQSSSLEKERLHPLRDPCKFGSIIPICFESPLISTLDCMVYSSWLKQLVVGYDPTTFKIKATSPLLVDENLDLGTIHNPNLNAIQSLVSSISPNQSQNSWAIDASHFIIEQEHHLLNQIHRMLESSLFKNAVVNKDAEIIGATTGESIERRFKIERPTLTVYQPFGTSRLIEHDKYIIQQRSNPTLLSRYVGSIYVGALSSCQSPAIRTTSTTNHFFKANPLEWRHHTHIRRAPEVPAFAEGIVMFVEYPIYCEEYLIALDYSPTNVLSRNHQEAEDDENEEEDGHDYDADDDKRYDYPLISTAAWLLEWPEISIARLQRFLMQIDEVMSLSCNTNLALPLYHEYKSCKINAEYLEYLDYALLLALASTGKYTLGLTYLRVCGYSQDGYFYQRNYNGMLTHSMKTAYHWDSVNESLQAMPIDTNHVLNRRMCCFHIANEAYHYQIKCDHSDDRNYQDVLYCVVVIARL